MLSSTFQLSAAVFCFLNVKLADGFTCNPVAWRQPASSNLKSQHFTALAAFGKGNDDGVVGEGDNWLEKSFPVNTEEGIDIKKVEDFNLGISGESFQTGPLGKRMFEAIVSRTSLDISDEVLQALTLYAMDFTAKEAARAALKQNGLQMVLQEEEEDQGMWGDVEAIRLYDNKTGKKINKLYDSLEDAVNNWVPGQQFDFVVRQVPAKVRELSVEELLQALDPNGKLREEARATKGASSLSDEEALALIFDDDEIKTLSDLATINVKRTNDSPRGASVEAEAYAGLDKAGYRVIKYSDLMQDSINADGTENEKSKSDHLSHFEC
jgi:phosphopantetheinyl transferase (holo-ACP synthase)